jgi:nicotinamide-nucleotide amidase
VAVDADVAAAMAIGVRTALGATWGVATTGVAGPDPVDSHPPGEVHLAVAGPDGVQARSLHLPGDRLRVRTLASAGVLDGLRRLLSGREWRAARGR